jgi:hypothetical protein
MKIIITGMGVGTASCGPRIDYSLLTSCRSRTRMDTAGALMSTPRSHIVATTTLEPNTARNPSPTRIEITALPGPIKTEYGQARATLRELHDKYAESEVELFIHLGEARGWDFVTVERVVYKQGMSSTWFNSGEGQREYYNIPDDIGEAIGDIGPCPWQNVPVGLSPSIDADRVAGGANAILKATYHFAKSDASKTTFQKTAGRGLDQAGVDFSVPIEVKPHNEGGPYL